MIEPSAEARYTEEGIEALRLLAARFPSSQNPWAARQVERALEEAEEAALARGAVVCIDELTEHLPHFAQEVLRTAIDTVEAEQWVREWGGSL